MLVLTSRIGERIFLGGVSVMLVDVVGDKARLGFEAPPAVHILREAIKRRIEAGQQVDCARWTAKDIAAMTAGDDGSGRRPGGAGSA